MHESQDERAQILPNFGHAARFTGHMTLFSRSTLGRNTCLPFGAVISRNVSCISALVNELSFRRSVVSQKSPMHISTLS